MRQDNSFVCDFVIFLARKRNSSATQFNDQSVLVDDFIVALSQLAMNFHANTYELKNFFFVKQLRHKLHPIQTRISTITLIGSAVFVAIRVIRVYARTTAIKWRNSSSISLGMATVWAISSRSKAW